MYFGTLCVRTGERVYISDGGTTNSFWTALWWNTNLRCSPNNHIVITTFLVVFRTLLTGMISLSPYCPVFRFSLVLCFVMTGFLLDCSILLTCLLWTPQPHQEYVLVILSTFLGISGAVWSTQVGGKKVPI